MASNELHYCCVNKLMISLIAFNVTFYIILVLIMSCQTVSFIMLIGRVKQSTNMTKQSTDLLQEIDINHIKYPT